MAIYKDEERGTWYCSFYYTDWQGKRKKKMKRGFKLQRDAREWEREFLEQYSKNPDIKFSSLYDKYIEYLKPRVRHSTIVTREVACKNHILPYFSNLVVSDITPADVVHWQNEILSKGFSDAYNYLLNAFLKAIFNYAVNYQGLLKSPCNKAIGSTKRKNVTFWTPEEYKQFIECIDKDTIYYPIFETLYYTGMRIGEVLALTPKDIDFDNNTISINKTFYHAGGKDVINPPKTKESERVITIPRFLANEIKEYMNHLYDLHDDERIFGYQHTAVRAKLNEVAERANVKRIRIHDLRHSHASMLINMGANPLLISKRLGHESPDITLKIYSHLFPTTETDIIEKINKI